MGHKINPLVFRLGMTNNWQYNLKENKNWITNYMIYQLVSNQFLRYTSRHFNYLKKRNSRHSTGLVIMKGERQLRANNFIKRSMLFSHLLIGSLNNKLFINCFFYDYKIWKTKNNRVKKFLKYNQLFSNFFLKFRTKRNYFKKRVKKFLRKLPRKLIKWLIHMLPNFWIYNLNIRSISGKKATLNLFKLNKIWLRLFSKLSKFTTKEKKFYLNVWHYLLSSILPNLKNRMVAHRIYFIILNINLFNFNNALLNSSFFFNLYRTRYFLFKSVSKSITQNLKSLLNSEISLVIKYHAIRERKMTSSLLTNLILIKLGQYYRINSIIYPLATWIKRHKNVLGYRLMISGRLTRRERASHMVKSGRSMPLSSIRHKIDYHQDVKIMKFGMVGIKVYLFLNKKLRNSYYYLKFAS